MTAALDLPIVRRRKLTRTHHGSLQPARLGPDAQKLEKEFVGAMSETTANQPPAPEADSPAKPSPIPARGAVVTLRRAVPTDAEMLRAWRAEPAVRQYQPIVQTSAVALAEVLTQRAALGISPDLAGEVQWIILAGGIPVGWITLRVSSRTHRVAEIGYSLATAYHGRGFMTVALPQAIGIAFDPAGVDLARLDARAAITNQASRRTLERAGFTLEGIARRSAVIDGERVDHALYGRLCDDLIVGGSSRS